MSRKTSLVVGFLAVASVFALLVSPAQAGVVVGFKFTDGSTSVTVPATGGTYLVNIWLSSDNPAVTNLGVGSLFYGALSTILNSNLGNGTLTGDVTAQALHPNLSGSGGTDGDIGDVNGDSRADLGPVANTTNLNAGATGPHPWWIHTTTAGAPLFYASGTTALMGTFTVTIPAFTPNGNGGDFLKYGPNLQVSVAAGNYDFWGEVTSTSSTNRGGKFNTATGLTFINLGTQVTFAVEVPEPATIVLLGLAGVGLISFCRPKRRTS